MKIKRRRVYTLVVFGLFGWREIGMTVNASKNCGFGSYRICVIGLCIYKYLCMCIYAEMGGIDVSSLGQISNF